MKKEIIQTVKTIALALILGAGIQFAMADWTSAPSNPPASNVDAPVNIGSTTQAKLGSLQLNKSTSGAVAAVGLSVWGNSSTPVRFVDSTPGDDAGKVLTSDANGYGSWQNVASTSNVHGTVILSSASGSWTVPANVYSIEVHVVGAGASGRYYGGMGGGYATARRSVTPGQVIPFTVGTGGVAVCNAGGDGGSSTFDSGSNLITAYGGVSSISDNPGSATISTPVNAGAWNGGDWGAYGHSWLDGASAALTGRDKSPGFSSGFPYSRGGGASNNGPQATINTNPTYGGGGSGDTDSTGGYCGSNGANGIIIVQY